MRGAVQGLQAEDCARGSCGREEGVEASEMMERYAAFVIRHRFAVVMGVLAVSALAASQLGRLRLQIDRRAQLPQNHPYVQVQNAIADQFGGETTLVIGVIPSAGDVFTSEVLHKIVRITARLESSPGIVRSNLLSIASQRAKSIRGDSNAVDISPILAEVPEDASGLEALRQKVLADEIYGRLLVGRDGRAAAIVADFDDSLTDRQIYEAAEAAIEPERGPGVQFAISGAPVVRVYASRYTSSIRFLFPAAVLVIGLVHYEAFRTLQAMFLPLVTALLSVLWALGIVGAARQPLDTWTAMTPVVILAIAAGHAVQILKRYYEEFASVGDNHAAIVRSLAAVGPVTLTAGLIAAAGFGSLVSFGVASVRVFGLLLAAGIGSALVIEMTFIPACRAMLLAPRPSEARRERRRGFLTRSIDLIGRQALARPGRILTAAAAVLVVSAVGALRVHVDNSLSSWFPSDSRYRVDDHLLNERLAGTSTLYILLEGQTEGDLESPEVLRAVRDLQRWLETNPEVGATLSFADFVERMHAALSGEQNGHLPEKRDLIAQYLLLYSLSGPDDFSSLVDPAHRVAVLRAYVKSDEADFARRLFDRLGVYAAGRFRGLPVEPRLAGGALSVQFALNEVVVQQKLANVVQVAAIIFVLSSFVLRSIAGGLLVLAPLLLAVAVNFGIMGFTGTWLSIATASITAMAVSMGADFAIYFIFRLREEMRRRGGDLGASIETSLQSSGQAIFFVSSAVAAGYLLLSFSGFRVWIYLGSLTTVMVVVSALGALTVIPALIVVLRPRFLWRGDHSNPA
jgi:predicted RND superfamily exporter protein